MDIRELQSGLTRSIQRFESEYPRWGKYTLSIRPETTKVEIKSNEGVVDTRIAGKLLRDFTNVLKRDNLMITSRRPSYIRIDEYSYLAEEGLEEIADEIEVKLGAMITNLSVVERGDKPYVRFAYTGTLSEDDKSAVRKTIDEIINQYSALDEDEVFAEINFDDADEIDEMIEEHNLEAQLKADDSKLTGGKAENMTELQIAERHGVEEDYIKAQIEIGMIVESEHSNDNEIVRDIVLDHLFELPDYYVRLEEMESEAEGEIPSDQDSPFTEADLDMKAEDEKACDEVEVDYDNTQELAELYNNAADGAYEELHTYLKQFGPEDEDVDVTLAKMTYDEIDGYIDIINRWM